MWVDYTDEPFDSYRAVMRWDSTILHYVTAVEGTVMTNACGTKTWFLLNPGVDSVEIEHIFFPCDTAVTGPGSVSDLIFEAQVEGETDVIFDYIMFARDGTTLVARNTEIVSHDGFAIVEFAGAGTQPRPQTDPTSLTARPNPSRTFGIWWEGSDTSWLERGTSVLYVCDIRGRIVRHIWSGNLGAREYHHSWDGLDGNGRQVPPGVYFVRLSTPGQALTRKVTLIR
jgi:hypothetical protein